MNIGAPRDDGVWIVSFSEEGRRDQCADAQEEVKRRPVIHAVTAIRSSSGLDFNPKLNACSYFKGSTQSALIVAVKDSTFLFCQKRGKYDHSCVGKKGVEHRNRGEIKRMVARELC